jgi:hypothetical protein
MKDLLAALVTQVTLSNSQIDKDCQRIVPKTYDWRDLRHICQNQRLHSCCEHIEL